jgi:hypothetical protein
MFIAPAWSKSPLRRSGAFLCCAPTERKEQIHTAWSYKHLAPTELPNEELA